MGHRRTPAYDDAVPGELRPGELPSTPEGERRGARGSRVADAVASTPELIPALIAVGVFVFWATAQGGSAATDWYPGTLILLGALVITGIAYRGRLFTLPRLVSVAIGLLALFVIWNFLSISWA